MAKEEIKKLQSLAPVDVVVDVVGTIMTAHNSIFLGPIKTFGNNNQKRNILPDFVTGNNTETERMFC